MNANPHTCPHLNLTYDGTFAIVRCMDCDTTWDADTPVPLDKRDEVTREWFALADVIEFVDTITNDPDFHKPRLNPDNEPTSEHQQWRKDNDDDIR